MFRTPSSGSPSMSARMQRRAFVGQGLALLSASCYASGRAAEVQNTPGGDQPLPSQTAPDGSTISTMRVALGQFSVPEPGLLTFIKQCGVDDVVLNTARLPGEARWELPDLLQLRRTVEEAGLRIFALENVPRGFYDKIMLGAPGARCSWRTCVRPCRTLGKRESACWDTISCPTACGARHRCRSEVAHWQPRLTHPK